MVYVLDLGVVSALAIDLGSPHEALEFIDRFEASLSWRVHVVCDAFASRDHDQMIAALTSLHTHALMIGALQLHTITGYALAHIDHGSYRPGASATATDTRYSFLWNLIDEVTLFKHAYTALRLNPTLLDAPAP